MTSPTALKREGGGATLKVSEYPTFQILQQKRPNVVEASEVLRSLDFELVKVTSGSKSCLYWSNKSEFTYFKQ